MRVIPPTAIRTQPVDVEAPTPIIPTIQSARTRIAEHFSSLQRSRDKAIAEKKSDDTTNKEYAHRVCLVSAELHHLTSEITQGRIHHLTRATQQMPEIAAYDPLQDGKWRKEEPELIDHLEHLLISTLSERFSGTDQKHHLFQAIRCLAIEDLPSAKRDIVLSTILPYHTPPALVSRKRRWHERLSDLMSAEKYSVEVEQGLRLKFVDRVSVENLNDLIAFARDQGYAEVQMQINGQEYWRHQEEIKKHALSIRELSSYNSTELVFPAAVREPLVDVAAVNDYLMTICDADIIPEITASLDSTTDQRAFGQAFMKAIDDNISRPAPKIATQIERALGQVAYRHEATIGEYRKDTAALCTQERRYLITIVSQNKEDPLPRIARQLALKGPEEDVLELLRKEDEKLCHARIITYMNTEPARDIEVNS